MTPAAELATLRPVNAVATKPCRTTPSLRNCSSPATSSATITTWSGLDASRTVSKSHYRIIRWYDPVTARWLSNDPIGISGGLNQYVFCANNPVNARDPLGLCEKRKPKYRILNGHELLAAHLRSVIHGGFPRGYFAPEADPKMSVGSTGLFLLDGVIYTSDEIGNIAAGRTAYMRGGAPEFLAAKYGGEAPMWWNWSGFSQGWQAGWGPLKPTTSLFEGILGVVEGAAGSWDMNNLGREMAEAGE